VGYLQSSQTDTDVYRHKKFKVIETSNPILLKICKTLCQIIER
jgi:hypothetical protein